MSSKNIKIIITIYIINVFIVSRNQALQSKEKNKYQYDLDTSYPDYELLDKNIDSTSKIDFTPVELLKSVVTNTYKEVALYGLSTTNSEMIQIAQRSQTILDFVSSKLKMSSITNPESKKSKETTSGLDLDLSFATGIFGSFQSRVKAIYPGTVWCGTGDSAKSQKDIGLFYVTDSCCQAHDTCPKFIPAKSVLFGLKNTGTFTRSHCICDHIFYTCLKRANSFISNKMGYTYFTLLAPQCFRKEHPVEGCAKINDKRCVSYLIDETKNKTWQWFDNDIY